MQDEKVAKISYLGGFPARNPRIGADWGQIWQGIANLQGEKPKKVILILAVFCG